jgi:hypothetical protein
VNIAKANAVRLRDADGKLERLITANYPVSMIVGNGNVPAARDLQREGKGAFAALLFGLNRVEFPVLNSIELNLVANVVFA